jgi:hypothetical protein
MVFMIIFKWLNVYDPSLAPSIITTMINMTLTPTQIVLIFFNNLNLYYQLIKKVTLSIMG